MNIDMVFTIWPWPEGLSTPSNKDVWLYRRAKFFRADASVFGDVWEVKWQPDIHNARMYVLWHPLGRRATYWYLWNYKLGEYA